MAHRKLVFGIKRLLRRPRNEARTTCRIPVRPSKLRRALADEPGPTRAELERLEQELIAMNDEPPVEFLPQEAKEPTSIMIPWPAVQPNLTLHRMMMSLGSTARRAPLLN